MASLAQVDLSAQCFTPVSYDHLHCSIAADVFR